MAERTVHRLVRFTNPVVQYALYEAIIDTETLDMLWIADEPIRREIFQDYDIAINAWIRREKKYSSLLDILEEEEYREFLKEYEEKELNF